MARTPWSPGDPCPRCAESITSEQWLYKPGRAICKACGAEERRVQQAKRMRAIAKACTVCKADLYRNDKRFGVCAPCRKAKADAKNAARKCCKCERSIADRPKNALYCVKCCSRARATAAKKNNAKAKLERRVEARPPVVYRAFAGLRGPDSEWENGPTDVPAWATLDGWRV